MPRLCTLILITVVVAGCPYSHSVPKNPTPMVALNTPFDDYNMAPPPAYHDFVWSTNRGSQGKHFDLWTASGDYDGGNTRYFPPDADGRPRPLTHLASPGNEFGPTYVGPYRGLLEGRGGKRSLVFASDRAGGQGGLDLYKMDGATNEIKPLAVFNGPANDAYWSQFKKVQYFASDRGGKGYDIYQLVDGTITRLDVLCSDADDTAPFATYVGDGHAVLFASNRKGGRGGWDLYSAVFRDGVWRKPKNLGRRFNTAHNEFRPATTGQVLIFSSDRPGGQGGFDLYYSLAPDLD